MDNLFFRGTIFSIKFHQNNQYANEAFMLVETFEDDYMFEIIQITGYHSGCICGYVKKGTLYRTHVIAITLKELIETIKCNFSNPDIVSLVFYKDIDLV